ncbi:hypothetical protein [Oceanisphaera arctica]|uniref:Uncharacterized protein n=1 Tax=Oceanisphaera arctica TaxID=641510 RepID=A0A2P5TK80_9GAMM|nr:hypothetical protein [Oceanisphaera arctica]PPL15476.1 hypothetical protein UN63_12420 [Oceanisphaera arctica]GHA05378.1 hypothetical protein GCM10007082_02840 [Oceanisphaera arctica]
MTPAERKQKSRAAAKAAGIVRVEVSLGINESNRLDELCKTRGGVRGPYSADEYLTLLIHRDWQKLQSQLAELGTCNHCGDPLPEGCKGLFKGAGTCWHTTEAKALEL